MDINHNFFKVFDFYETFSFCYFWILSLIISQRSFFFLVCCHQNFKMNQLTTRKKQEEFRERRHLHVCDLWPWVVTLTVSQDQKGLCHYMVLIALYPGTRYDVCEFISLRDMTISSFLWPLTFSCDLHRPSKSLSFLSLDGRYVVVYWFQVRSL